MTILRNPTTNGHASTHEENRGEMKVPASIRFLDVDITEEERESFRARITRNLRQKLSPKDLETLERLEQQAEKIANE